MPSDDPYDGTLIGAVHDVAEAWRPIGDRIEAFAVLILNALLVAITWVSKHLQRKGNEQ